MAHTVASGLSAGKTKFRLTDFLLRWGRKRQSASEQLEIFRGLAARQKGASVDDR